MTTPLLVLAASARAMAQSAVRAGFAPRAIDLFADRDLQALAECRQIKRFPADFLAAVRSLSASIPSETAWLYTGGLENHPRIIEAISQQWLLLGNTADLLPATRDPWRVADVLTAAGIDTPSLCKLTDRPPADGSWLLKQTRASGGWHVRPWTDDFAQGTPIAKNDTNFYLQQFVPGTVLGVTYLAARGDARWLGTTEMLVGREWSASEPFTYAGSIGPYQPLSAVQQQTLRQIGQVAAQAFNLRGLFGVDVVLNEQGIWVLEINPRYTASVEVLERAWSADDPWLALHVAACLTGDLPDQARFDLSRRASADWHGKVVLYAEKAGAVSDPQSDQLFAQSRGLWPEVADIPWGGTCYSVGQPLCTLFASAGSRERLLVNLRQRLRETRELLQC